MKIGSFGRWKIDDFSPVLSLGDLVLLGTFLVPTRVGPAGLPDRERSEASLLALPLSLAWFFVALR